RGALRAVAATARQATGDQPSLTAAWASVHWDEKAFRAMSNQQALLVFLRALLAAKKSLALYPPTSEAATAWIERLRRSLDDAFRQGLIFPIRVGRDRFTWAGGELPTTAPAPPGNLDVGWSTGTEESGSGPILRGTGADTLDRLVESILKVVDERFENLTYERTGLLEWFETVSRGGRFDLLYAAIKTLGAMAQGSGDREVRARTTLEALMLLPDATQTPLFGDYLLPGAGTDLTAFNLLTQVTEDELRQIARHVPRERLVALTTELLEYPWEEGKRLRLLEAITLTLERGTEPGAPPAG